MTYTQTFTTKHWYNNRKSARSLTDAEKQAAQTLRRQRPKVYPGTRVCIDRDAQLKWFDKVRAEGKRLKVQDRDWQAFCDVAGVPD